MDILLDEKEIEIGSYESYNSIFVCVFPPELKEKGKITA